MRGYTVLGFLPLGAFLVAASLSGPSCPQANAPCTADALPELSVFLVESGGENASGFVGTVSAVLPPSDLGIRRYRVRTEGGERTIGFAAAGDSLPILEGREYSFHIEVVPGEPTPCAITIHDQDGLLYAAVADYAPGERVLRDGLAGFAFGTVDSGCPPRADNPCFVAEKNLTLRVSRAGDQVSLGQGESGPLGAYTVTCRSARSITYSERCADAGVLQVSWVIRRGA